MCGLSGFLQTSILDHLSATAQVQAMSERLRHRGPDDAGLWLDPEAGFALAHRRLAILDLSQAGHQPMQSSNGQWVLAFNGEIYNHRALRRELEREGSAPAWRGHSDTETLLACIQAWGLERSLKASVGMFALALWERKARRLYLARDRMGEKPLYYGWQSGVFLFGSELKALSAHPAFEHRINRDAVATLLRYNYIPAPHSIWQGIAKLEPGCWIELAPGQRQIQTRSYWSLGAAAEAGQATPFPGDQESASRALEQILGEVIDAQMLADVPLGALLSGGIDSSLIVALMQARATRPIRTFSIGFDERQFDESAHAAAVARHLGTEHNELRMRARDVLDMVSEMPSIYDEPFADSSQLPTLMVMRLVRRQVKVALSGDGGDELFCGYNRYLLAPRLWRLLRPLPAPLRHTLGRILLSQPSQRWDRLLAPLAPLLRQAHPGHKLHRLGHRMQQVRNFDDLYLSLVTEWQQAETMVPGAQYAQTRLSHRQDWPQLLQAEHRMMALDTLSYLPDDILVKVDRAAMAVSLETRAPFLDHRVVEFAWQLPLSHKLQQGQSKAILRRLLYRHVPRALVERPKMGFGIPLDDWLRGPLRDWGESLLSESALLQSGLLDPAPVRQVWQQHQVRAGAFGYRLWSVLMLQAWWQRHGQTSR